MKIKCIDCGIEMEKKGVRVRCIKCSNKRDKQLAAERRKTQENKDYMRKRNQDNRYRNR